MLMPILLIFAGAIGAGVVLGIGAAIAGEIELQIGKTKFERELRLVLAAEASVVLTEKRSRLDSHCPLLGHPLATGIVESAARITPLLT